MENQLRTAGQVGVPPSGGCGENRLKAVLQPGGNMERSRAGVSGSWSTCFWLALGTLLVMAGPGRAGLDSITEPPHDYRIPKKGIQAIPADRFRQDWLLELRGISAAVKPPPTEPGQPPPPPTIRDKYLLRRDEL